MNPAEQILSDLFVVLKGLYPTIEMESTKNKLATVLSEYYIQKPGQIVKKLVGSKIEYLC